MKIEIRHDGGFIKLYFDTFFSQMSSDECEHMLHLLIDEYGMSVEDVDMNFRRSINLTQIKRKKAALQNVYRFFRRKYMGEMEDGTV